MFNWCGTEVELGIQRLRMWQSICTNFRDCILVVCVVLGEFEFENGPRGIGMVTVDPWAATLLFVAFIIVVNMLLVCVTCLPARHGHLLILARYHR